MRPYSRQLCRHSRFRRGITLIEMLVAIAISLMVLLAIISIFDQLNTSMNASKATIEQAGELRNLTQRLQNDLDGRTALTLPWTPPDAGDGYFEYVEGAQTDLVGQNTVLANNTYWGDRDDILMFTARSKGKPFIGRFNGNIIESEFAEIIWWVDDKGDPTNVRNNVIRRRVFLIRPDLTGLVGSLATFRNDNDVSVRLEAGSLVPNSLADLTLRQNRVGHSTTFPHPFTGLAAVTGTYAGMDVVLDKVAAFDVRVFDPLAPLRTAPGDAAALAPGDIGWATGTNIGATGAFVDLNYAGNNTLSFFSGPPNPVSRAPLNATLSPPTYSTWPEAYEQDGLNQDGDVDGSSNSMIDEGRDGFDSGGLSAAVDDIGETETFPPYPHAIAGQQYSGLRGVQVRIRLVEPDSRQVRQATVVSEFLPE